MNRNKILYIINIVDFCDLNYSFSLQCKLWKSLWQLVTSKQTANIILERRHPPSIGNTPLGLSSLLHKTLLTFTNDHDTERCPNRLDSAGGIWSLCSTGTRTEENNNRQLLSIKSYSLYKYPTKTFQNVLCQICVNFTWLLTRLAMTLSVHFSKLNSSLEKKG